MNWDLSELYPGLDDRHVEQDLAAAVSAAQAFGARYQGRVADLDAGALASAAAELETVLDRLGRPDVYTRLASCVDVGDALAAAVRRRAERAASEVEAAVAFFWSEWLAVPEPVARATLAEHALREYAHPLRDARRAAPHRLSTAQEEVLARTRVARVDAWVGLHADAVSSIQVDLDGGLSLASALALLEHPSRERRAAAAAAVSAALERELPLCAYVFGVRADERAVEDDLRGRPDWLTEAVVTNRVEPATVASAVATVRERYALCRRHYRLRARLLGLPELADHDRLAPVAAPARIQWADAREAVVAAWSDLSPELGGAASQLFDRGWIDAEPRVGKAFGAFSIAPPRHHPYVLLSFGGDRRSLATLAHEVGHGLHQLAYAHLGSLRNDVPPILAELVATFSEQVVMRRLARSERDPERRLALLVGLLDDVVANVFRQIALHVFEDEAHTRHRATRELSAVELGELWLATQQELYGDAVELSPGYAAWWSYVPHFVLSPGYVHTYALAYLLSLSIAAQVEERGLPREWPEVLAAGASRPQEELLGELGIDLRDADTWSRAFEPVAALLDEVERLVQTPATAAT